jgi:hypothetical protein
MFDKNETTNSKGCKCVIRNRQFVEVKQTICRCKTEITEYI